MKDLSSFQDLPLNSQHAILEGPAMKPPNGTLPNFDHNGAQNILALSVWISISTVVTLLVASRLYTRFFYQRKVTIVDVVAVAAFGAFASFVFFTWKIVAKPGLFVHQWNVQFKEMRYILYYISASSANYGIVNMLLKVGILLHWTELFVPTGTCNAFWWTCHSTMWINGLFYVICTFIEVFGCSPQAKMWNLTLRGKCMEMAKVQIASAFVNFFSDLVILIFPQKVIWNLHLSRHRKISTASLFAVGAFATVCAGFRIKSVFDFFNNEDITYVVCELGLWCLAEMAAGFAVLCSPCLPKLFKNSPWIQKFLASFTSTRAHSDALESSGARRSTNSWPRSRPRKAPDASLFTDTNISGFVPLENISQGSITDIGRNKLATVHVTESRGN